MTQPTHDKMHTIRQDGHVFRMEYVFQAEIAALRASRNGQFQEVPVLQWVRGLKLKGCYFDAGAHVGNHSLFFHSFCPSTSVISVEAHPQIFRLLERNMDRNAFALVNIPPPGPHKKPFYLHNAAVWNENGKVSIGSIPHNNAGHTKLAPKGGTMVQAKMIDDLADQGKVVVLKIDVEDVEEQAIQGAQRVLREDHPVVIAERHSQKQLKWMDDALAKHGYKRVQNWEGCHTYAWR
jgi:FkbM family methyltransferase